MSCLLSIVHTNKYFLYSHDSGKLSSENKPELCSTGPLAHLLTVIPLAPTYKHILTQFGSIWTDADNPWNFSIILKPNFPIQIV